MLSPFSLGAINQELRKYPPDRRQSALLAALRIAQDEHRWLSREVIEHVADLLGVPVIRAYEVASFYSLYDLAAVGKHRIFVCTNISCMLRGSAQIVEHLQNRLGIRLNQTTADGRFTLKAAECLCACAGAPMLQIDHDYHENLTPERVDAILPQYS